MRDGSGHHHRRERRGQPGATTAEEHADLGMPILDVDNAKKLCVICNFDETRLCWRLTIHFIQSLE